MNCSYIIQFLDHHYVREFSMLGCLVRCVLCGMGVWMCLCARTRRVMCYRRSRQCYIAESPTTPHVRTHVHIHMVKHFVPQRHVTSSRSTRCLWTRAWLACMSMYVCVSVCVGVFMQCRPRTKVHKYVRTGTHTRTHRHQ